MRLSPFAAAALVLAAGLVACGDDASALSADEFRKEGNAICQAGDAELEEAGKGLLGEEGDTLPSPKALADFFTGQAIPIARKKLDQLEKLRPPQGDRDTHEEMIASGREATDEVEKGLKKDPEGFLAEKGPDPFDDFNEAALDLGLDECAGDQ